MLSVDVEEDRGAVEFEAQAPDAGWWVGVWHGESLVECRV